MQRGSKRGAIATGIDHCWPAYFRSRKRRSLTCSGVNPAAVIAALDADLLDGMADLLFHEADDAGGGRRVVAPERTRDAALDRPGRAPLIETDQAAGVGTGLQAPQDQLGIGHRRFLAAQAI